MRINSFLARCGLGSRRKVEQLILNNEIFVNGSNIVSLSTQIDPLLDEVIYKNKKIKLEEEKHYIILNKPKLVLSSVSDDRGRKTVLDLIDCPVKIFPIGRLDYNTEGLLLLTNDGEFANSITHPSKRIGKTYEVITRSRLKPIELVNLRKGVIIDEVVKTQPANVSNSEMIGENRFKTTIEIFEGKNRQVRKMFDSIGHKVIDLKRVKIGSLSLGNIKIGKYRELTENEKLLIFKNEE